MFFSVRDQFDRQHAVATQQRQAQADQHNALRQSQLTLRQVNDESCEQRERERESIHVNF